ncbi:MAG: ATP-binding response regulator [Gammaproteobacteria bacterium]
MATIPRSVTALSKAVLSERVRLLYKQVPTALVGFLGSSSIAVIVFFDLVSVASLLFWLGSLVLVSIAVFINYYLYRCSAQPPCNAALWLMRLTIVMSAFSIVAGLSGIVFFVENSLSYQLILMIILFAWSGGAAIAAASYAPGFYIAIFAILVPYCSRLLYEGGFLHVALACGVLSFVIPLIWVHKNINHMIIKALKLQYEHAALARYLQVQKDRAEQANIAKSRFLAAASHDLRQPLHALGLFVGELKARISDYKSSAIIEKIEASATAMTKLFNTLLDISKLDAGVIHPDIKSFPINDLLAEIELESFPQAGAKSLRFKVVPCKAIVRSDPTLLASMIRNLVSNAVRYTASGGVVLGCRYRGDTLSVEVWDSGVGIHPDAQRSIFQEFVQLGNPERDRDKGLGLGLAVTARIAALLNHKITLVSRPGRGSKFSIELPIAKEYPVSIEVLPAPKLVKSHLAGLNVLVVDDDRAVLEAMHGILTSWGCHVIMATSTAGLLDKLVSWVKHPDVIIADYRLPDHETGVHAIAAIRAVFNAKIPAILVTGDTAPGDLKSLETIDYPILHKPVRPDHLKQLLNEIT